MFELDDTQRAFETAVRGWCERELAPAVPALESGERLPYELLRSLGTDLGVAELLTAMGEARLARLSAPAASKGMRSDADPTTPTQLGGDPLLTSVLLKEISRVSPGVALVLISTLGCAMTILERGTAALVERYALPLLRFEKIGAWALTEPGAGSDAFGGMQTRAVVEGDALVLSGQKTFISNAPHADLFAIYARVVRSEGEPVVRPVLVERGTAGLETGPPLRKMGMHDAPTGEIFLHACRVPRANLLGSLGEPTQARGGPALQTLNLERSVMPAMCLGIIERCVEESVSYAKERRQFGRAIAEFQGIAFKLARMELALENARNLVLKLAWAQREGKLDARLASLAKLYCAEQAVAVSLAAIQVHGGAGYMAELPLEKLMRDAKMFEIGGGTNEIQLQTIARSILS